MDDRGQYFGKASGACYAPGLELTVAFPKQNYHFKGGILFEAKALI